MPGYPYYPLPPKRNNVVLIVVIVVVLVIAVPTILAAILYIMVSGLIDGPTTSKPVITFASPVAISGGEELTIAAVSMATSPSNFKVNLLVNARTGAAVNAPAGSGSAYRVYVPIDFDIYAVEWIDIGGEGMLSAGDLYRITVANGSWPGGATMTFYLLWSDGALIASVSWTASYSKPVVSFTTGVPVTDGEQLTIVSTSMAVGPANYEVNLRINATTGTAVAMPTTGGGTVSLSVTGYAGTFTVTWTDIGGERTVNGGDSFTVTRLGGLPIASSYTFYLLWSDGSQITSTAWSTP